MEDTRKRINVHPIVKSHIETLKQKLGLKTESEVIYYLTKIYTEYARQIRQYEHEAFVEESEMIHRKQGSLF